MRICRFCGNEERAELLDIYPEDRTFLAGETCCEELGFILHEDFDFAFDYFKDEIEAISKQTVRGLRPWIGLNMKLQIKPIRLKEAKDFISKHHRHNKPPLSWRFGASIWNWETLVGVVMVGRPVARLLDHKSIVEVNRLCIDPSLDKELSAHACSMLYSWSAKQAKKRGFKKIITYILETEKGTGLKASGWINDGMTKGGSWNRRSRPRLDSAPTVKKVRFIKILNNKKERKVS